MLKLIFILSLFTWSLSARPQGELTTGNPIHISSLGVQLTPPTGMRTELAGDSEATNYHFPWFTGTHGLINIATISSSQEHNKLTESFNNNVSHPKSSLKLVGHQHIQTDSGIKAIKANFLSKDNSTVTRIYFKNASGTTCFIHILSKSEDDQILEKSILKSLKLAGTAKKATLPKEVLDSIGGRTGTPRTNEPKN